MAKARAFHFRTGVETNADKPPTVKACPDPKVTISLTEISVGNWCECAGPLARRARLFGALQSILAVEVEPVDNSEVKENPRDEIVVAINR